MWFSRKTKSHGFFCLLNYENREYTCYKVAKLEEKSHL